MKKYIHCTMWVFLDSIKFRRERERAEINWGSWGGKDLKEVFVDENEVLCIECVFF